MTSKLQPYADLKAKVREYTDKDGKVRGVYVKVGTLFASPHLSHMFINIESIPTGNWDGAVSVFKREDAQQSSETDAPINLKDIPF